MIQKNENNANVNDAITPRDKDFATWYDDVIKGANLAHYGKVKGTVVFTANATFIWENIQKALNKTFYNKGIRNVLMPSLIPYSSFNLEKEHLEGFAPEMFLVTKKAIDAQEMADPLVLRPTSEILFCYYFKDILVTYNQLPLKLNQWGNVFRVEKNTRPFLRTSEFHWHEMHSLHATEEEAYNFIKEINGNYVDFLKTYLDIPVLSGEKTINERFAGAENTFTCEAIMQDGQALQCATSHYLGQNFSKPYQITYRNANNQLSIPYQTSAGLSTRIIGAIIMTHSDDLGLVLPWEIAMNQITICPLRNDEIVNKYTAELAKELRSYRVFIDDSNNSMGWKIKDHQLVGTPILVLIGLKEALEKKVTIIYRDKNIKEEISYAEFIKNIQNFGNEYHNRLYAKAKARLDASIEICHTIDEVKKAIANKHFALAPWGGDANDEINFKKETTISPRCIKQEILDSEKLTCFYTNKKATHWVYFAKAY